MDDAITSTSGTAATSLSPKTATLARLLYELVRKYAPPLDGEGYRSYYARIAPALGQSRHSLEAYTRQTANAGWRIPRYNRLVALLDGLGVSDTDRALAIAAYAADGGRDTRVIRRKIKAT